jgi:ceramide glucosyltransferase
LIALAVPALLSSVYWLLALVASLRRSSPTRRTFAPPVSILKPTRGRDARFYQAIESHAVQDYPEFEILFGVRDPSDPALEDIHRLIANYPRIPIRIVHEAPVTPNGKAGMLIALAAAARHEVFIANDSDIVAPPGYLHSVVAPLEDCKNGMVTALYRARGYSAPARFEALGVATDFAPSVLVARLLGVAEFALGSTMALRAETLRSIGGFESVAGFLADDYQLGARVTKSGKHVAFADCVVETGLGAGSWRDVWKHQGVRRFDRHACRAVVACGAGCRAMACSCALPRDAPHCGACGGASGGRRRDCVVADAGAGPFRHGGLGRGTVRKHGGMAG